MYSHAKFQNSQKYRPRETLLFWLFNNTSNLFLSTLTSVYVICTDYPKKHIYHKNLKTVAYFLSFYMEKLMLIGNICSIVEEYVFASSYSTAIFHQPDQQQEFVVL